MCILKMRIIAAASLLVFTYFLFTPTFIFIQDCTSNSSRCSNSTSRAKSPPGVGGRPQMVLLLSYQRSGSSFVSDILFNSNKAIFNIYEPLDQLYAAMYGVETGWTVPSDITTHGDGTLRVPPPDELKAVTWMLHQLFTCNMTSLPTSVYIHRFWNTFASRMDSVKSYVTCMKAARITDMSLDSCQANIRQLCGNRFQEPKADGWRAACHDRLWTQTRHGKNVNGAVDTPLNLTGSLSRAFEMYDGCVRKYARSVSKCLPRLQTPCMTSRVRAIKTVRATMRSVAPLLKLLPEMKVLHLYRDPRAVALSRSLAKWSLSSFNWKDKNPAKIARVYCQTFLEDLSISKELQRVYPGRIKTVCFDHLMQDLGRAGKEIYGFLNLPVSDMATDFEVKKDTRRWEWMLSQDAVREIQQECAQFSRETAFNWTWRA